MSCRPSERGTPICRLGRGDVSSIEIRGKSLSSIEASWELGRSVAEADELSREYDLCVVTEAPSKRDDLHSSIGYNKTFRKISELVKKAGFAPSRVFVTFLVKCMPPKRKPTVQEIKSCSGYIKREIQAAEPKVIMPLGATALRLFNLHNKGGINAIRGQLFSLPLPQEKIEEEYNVIPSIDPGAFFYSSDPKLEKRILEDYRKAYSVAMTGTIDTSVYQCKYEVVSDVDALRYMVNQISKEKWFAFDTESRGFPWTQQPLICLSFSLGLDRNWVVPIYQHDSTGVDWKLKKFWNNGDNKIVIDLLRVIFEKKDIAVAAHNAKYDINVVKKHLGIEIKGKIYDSMLMHHVLLEQKPHGLEYLADLEFGTGDYSASLHDIVGRGKVLKAFYDAIPDNMLWPYAATDAECCYRLVELYRESLYKKPHLWKLYCEEVEPLIQTLTDAEWEGHLIDLNKVKAVRSDYDGEAKELLLNMRHKTFPGFNPSSTVHVRNALIELGFSDRIRDPTKATGYTTSREVLMEIKEDLPLADWILKYRNCIKILGTYIENVEKDVDKDGRVRYSWLIHGTESGRLSCRFYHQIPRKDNKRKNNLRDILVAAIGHKLVYFDYSQIELRVLAILADDKEMQRLFKENADIHHATAQIILGWTDEQVEQMGDRWDFNRQNCGKNVNFGLAYGSEGYRLVKTGQWEDIDGTRRPITWDMLNIGMERFKDRFVGLSNYLESVPDIARAQGNILITPFGRERRIGSKLNDREEGIRKAAEREIVNFSIQSPAGAVTCRTINLIHDWIMVWRSNGLPSSALHLVNTVHDSAVWEVRDDLVDWFVGNLKPAAEREIPELGNISIPCKIGVGQNWSDAEENAK